MFSYASLSLPVSLSPDWRRVLPLLVPPAAALALLGGVWVFAPAAAPAPQVGAARPAPVAPQPGLLVDVSGAVAHPGLYRVTRGERTDAAIAAAGGLTSAADQSRLPNMASVLKDGQQIRVPPVGSTGRGVGAAARVSLNSASAEQLASVPGFTPELVRATIEYRTQYGGFVTTRELMNLLGMSPADYARAKGHLTP